MWDPMERRTLAGARTVLAAAALVAATAGTAVAQESAPQPVLAVSSSAAADAETAAPAPDTTAPPAEQPVPGPDLSVPVLGVGTQVAMLMPTPTFGAGSFALCYDAGPVHLDVLGGLFLAEEFQSSVRGNVRVFFPIHRGPIADFSLGAGGGFGYLEHTDGELEAVGEILAGAKIRSFVGRNIALEAILGVNVLFVGDFQSVSAGGRLMGSAGFMYFFR